MTILLAVLGVQVLAVGLAALFGWMSGRGVALLVYLAGTLILTPPAVLLALPAARERAEARVQRPEPPNVQLAQKLREQYGQGPFRYMGAPPVAVERALGRPVERLVPADAEDFAAAAEQPVLVLYDASGARTEANAAKPVPPFTRLHWTWSGQEGVYYFYVPARAATRPAEG